MDIVTTCEIAPDKETGKLKTRRLTRAEGYVATLQMLLHYHERMMLMEKPCKNCEYVIGDSCAKKIFRDEYSDALIEAIRCIREVHNPDAPQ